MSELQDFRDHPVKKKLHVFTDQELSLGWESDITQLVDSQDSLYTKD